MTRDARSQDAASRDAMSSDITPFDITLHDGGPDVVVRWFEVSEDLVSMLGPAATDGGTGPVEIAEVAPARAAATVMVVRDVAGRGDASAPRAVGEGALEATPSAAEAPNVSDGDAVEVFMLRRRASMAFAPNRMVFPGGGVDARDADADLPWAGPSPKRWAEWLGAIDEAEARELVAAAAREVFEECGVLLAGPDEERLVGDVSGEEWEAERDRLLSREQSFAEMLIRRGLVLRTDLLRPWAHWVTPEFEPRRYDTRFFAARLPEGQIPDDRTSEADSADWVRPRELLAALAEGRAAMLPPTVVCVEQVAEAPDTETFLAWAPPMRRIMPVLERTDSGTLRMRVELPVAGGRP
ncbi:NUDIX hydrolase [Mobilicoccus pelagius]|uniref:Nudix hydrolase domain-containing protein n=1 Tax=Mobilicoccus pelagius NBRC 104925 TaxID=1089455 RepID=H5UP88_9MICO|nr:NUDIX domain-containing protein [Mobilicoccus pelagius]GAB47546.1 hypothetical protein MOPEL_020_00320 [Mobilicoccus pelagius NBRC 104925]